MTLTNLPPNTKATDSSTGTKDFFNSYYNAGISLSARDIDAAIGFFESRGFDITAANSIAATLLSQSKIENVNIFQILDTLKNLNDLQLTRVVSEILNYNRLNISTLGYKVDNSANNQFEIRNVLG
jgi:hypothetical protein